MYDFAYTQAPLSLEGVVMGLNLLTIGIGSYVASALVSIVNAASDPGKSMGNADVVPSYEVPARLAVFCMSSRLRTCVAARKADHVQPYVNLTNACMLGTLLDCHLIGRPVNF